MNDQPNVLRFFVGASLLLCVAITAMPQTTTQPVFVNPPNINYNGGTIELTGAKATIDWAGFSNVVTNVYSAAYAGKVYPPSYAPPTLRVNPGSTLHLNLTNSLDNTLYTCLTSPHGGPYTNLHYHGTEVSPLSPGDDVFIEVRQTPFLYKVPVPANHPDGMFWYHPHPHGCSFGQVNDGMSGALIIGDLLADQFPFIAGIKERILLLKDGDPRQNPQPPGPLITVNGLNTPLMKIAPGELQFFRFGNVGTDTYVAIAIPNVNAWIVAVDGFVLNLPILLDSTAGWLLPPASRVEMVVQGPAAGTYKIESLPVPINGPPQTITLATLVSIADSSAQPATPAQLAGLQQPPANRALLYPADQDFEGATTDHCTYLTPQTVPGCTFVFTENNGFQINGHTYDPTHLDVSCPLPSKNKWTLCNATAEHHAFHLHQIHFRVNDINGTPIPAPIRDTVDMPPQIDSQTPSKVHITTAFINPIIVGEFVLHCHLLAHEDLGMMQNIEIVPTATTVTKPPGKTPDFAKPGNRKAPDVAKGGTR
jgi:FtsP/CotA-like multicopper oxidase with cupredoxin domain